MIGILNISSLVLGLLAWILPVINLLHEKKQENNHWMMLSIISLSVCAISLFFQSFNTYQRVKLEDWSALMDIMGAKISVAFILLIVTILLNAANLIVYRKRIIK